MLMQLVCDKADRNDLDAFVMSSPAGVRLYTNFGFKEVGAVETIHGKFASMLRKARSTYNRKLKHAVQPSVSKLSPEPRNYSHRSILSLSSKAWCTSKLIVIFLASVFFPLATFYFIFFSVCFVRSRNVP